MPTYAINAFTFVAIDEGTGNLLVTGVADPALGDGFEVHVAIVDVNEPLRRCQKVLDEAGINPWDDVIPNRPANPVKPTQTFPPFEDKDEVYVVGAARSTEFRDLFVWGEKKTLFVVAQAMEELSGPEKEEVIIVEPL